MFPLEIAKLRRDNALKSLADGREAVPITLQFKGDLSKMSRADRKKWLRKRAEELYSNDQGRGLCLDLETVSPSAQTVEALCPVDYLDDITKKAQLNDDRVDIQRIQQVLH
jgi:hypothetical protein